MTSLELIYETVKHLDSKVDTIINNMVTKDSCKEKRDNCTYKEGTWSTKKIMALCSLVGAISAGVVSILKMFLIK